MNQGGLPAKLADQYWNYRSLPDHVRESLITQGQFRHQRELVGRVNGRDFINDSAATKVMATWFTMETICKPIIWITGDTLEPFTPFKLEPLVELVKTKVTAIIIMGRGAISEIIHRLMKGTMFIINVENMMEAVKCAHIMSKPGDAILLSPACPSFGLFENYADRGEQFVTEVKKIL